MSSMNFNDALIALMESFNCKILAIDNERVRVRVCERKREERKERNRLKGPHNATSQFADKHVVLR